ncbi:MAG TPA: sugar phosphate nucleotidyltransferase [Chitinophagaceae bacterium]|nr:sugar phosphate nucleotidyltransferase [Chitinophagaceae bacterium]
MKAMIFAAGLGTRFKPWTDSHPKALALVNGKSLLQRNVEYLQRYGITQLVVNVHHFADQVVEEIKRTNGWGSRILISDERDELLETGGGLLRAKPLFDAGQRFLTCNADILTDLDISRLVAFHAQQLPLITVSVMQRTSSRYLLFDADNRLCGWRNAATGAERIAVARSAYLPKAYSCVAVFEYEVFSLIGRTGKFSLIDLYLDLAAGHRILGYDHSGDRLADVGKPDSVAVAESLFP